MASMERRRFQVPDGDGGTETVDGWLLRPPGAQGPTPLLVDVHGGPATYVQFEYGPIAHWSMLWSQGWSILALNAVGSASYGRKFASRLRRRWGELDLPQHLAAVQQLQKEGLCDERLAISGKSYGGYMSAWAIGHTTQFRAAVVMAPVANIEAHYGTSDSGYYSDPYSLGRDGQLDRNVMRHLSPVFHAHNARTPTLILQGDSDQRCPRAQAEELFMILKRRTNVPCELVLYPGGSHKFTSEACLPHRVDAMQRITDWLTRWVDQPLPGGTNQE
jgi:dipeptidyl aminopeptidase/acylaminoacyl peptidase